MLSNTKFNFYAKQKFYSYLIAGSSLLVVSLALTSIVVYYYLSSNNGISALSVEAAIITDQVEKDETPVSYYSSIFSNLSRGLPINEGVSDTESLN
jgi:hypothetical protein